MVRIFLPSWSLACVRLDPDRTLQEHITLVKSPSLQTYFQTSRLPTHWKFVCLRSDINLIYNRQLLFSKDEKSQHCLYLRGILRHFGNHFKSDVDNNLLPSRKVYAADNVIRKGNEVPITEVSIQRLRRQKWVESRCPCRKPRHGTRVAPNNGLRSRFDVLAH